MKFKIAVSRSFYELEDPEVEALKGLGLGFEPNICSLDGKKRWYHDGGTEGELEIASLDELKAFISKCGQVVIHPPLYYRSDWAIEIYNGYRE